MGFPKVDFKINYTELKERGGGKILPKWDDLWTFSKSFKSNIFVAKKETPENNSSKNM